MDWIDTTYTCANCFTTTQGDALIALLEDQAAMLAHMALMQVYMLNLLALLGSLTVALTIFLGVMVWRRQ